MWLVAVVLLWSSGRVFAGDVLGWMLVPVATLVGTTNLCIPSYVFRSVFGFPPRRA